MSVVPTLEKLIKTTKERVAPLPKNPKIVFLYKPSTLALLRKVRRYIPEPTVNEGSSVTISTSPDLALSLRTMAYVENRTIAATARILIGLGMRAYRKLAEGLSPEAASDSLADEIIKEYNGQTHG